MRKCDKCDQPTEFKLCPSCALEDRHGVPSDNYDGEVEGERRYECRACGAEFVADADSDCPECGARERRFIEYVDREETDGGQRRLIADGGETPLPGQQRCRNGHVCGGSDNYCRVCSAPLNKDGGE